MKVDKRKMGKQIKMVRTSKMMTIFSFTLSVKLVPGDPGLDTVISIIIPP